MSFSPLQLFRERRLPESIYVELIGNLFSATPLIVVFAISQCVVGWAIVAQTGDPYVLSLTIIGLLISAERILMIRRYHREATAEPLTRATATVWETRFAVRSIATAVVVSALGVRCYMLPDPTVHMLIVGVLSTYAAGTITRVAYRPRLALTSVLIVSIPPAIACILHGGVIYICLALTTIIFLFGAVDVIQHAYETMVSQLTLKRRFAGLAQRDALTGLSNRLGLKKVWKPSSPMHSATVMVSRSIASISIASRRPTIFTATRPATRS